MSSCNGVGGCTVKKNENNKNKLTNQTYKNNEKMNNPGNILTDSKKNNFDDETEKIKGLMRKHGYEFQRSFSSHEEGNIKKITAKN